MPSETYHPLCPVKRKGKETEDGVSEEEVDHVVTLKTMQKMAHQMAKVEKTDSEGLSIFSLGKYFFDSFHFFAFQNLK